MPDNIIELDLGIRPGAAVSGAVCLQTEETAVLTFNAMQPTDRIGPYGPYMKDAGTAVVEFRRCIITRFGYPNDEPRGEIPQYAGAAGYGIYEVQDSTWIREVVRMNRIRFPRTKDDYVRKHFLFTFHDSTFECLADDLSLTVSREPYAAVFARVHRHVFEESAG